ncbi:MAG TPA: leucine--tRNA ligase [Candidatus Paceibacterota bacterium]|nr:leucine--tRNA ligase [Candidatus Paceibacterota bacterium]
MGKERFEHKPIEKAAQDKWDAAKLYETDLQDTSKEPYYLLFEFPYPSGDLHIGHWYAYAVTDIYARLLRMKGKNVLFPIGFDAFGLPAENAAMKQGANPAEWTLKNIEKMRAQIRSIGASLDWSKEVVTCSPEYYRWTQWLFAKLYEHGLAYRAEAAVKWCPKDATVLANEQVIDGKCERCDTEVVEKRLTQWFMKIKDYADRLLSDLDELPWREDIKEAQRAWIGRSQGARLWFPLQGREEKIEVFTTRPDTVFGATYVVLAPEHPLVDTLLTSVGNEKEIRAYKDQTARKTERERSENKEKSGVRLEGVMAVNPATQKEIPIYVADYVLASYGTGAVMAVPAHDERDHEFAKKYELPIQQVVEGEGECYTGDGKLINSGKFSGKDNTKAMPEIVKFVGGEHTTNYRIRDWLISRQRYWGCPIPIVYDPEGRAHTVPAEHMPWLLPEDVDFSPTGKAPLASSKELHERVERIFGKGWTPEYDTLDTFVDSSWYFLRYLAPNSTTEFSDNELMKTWLPVKRYSGGSEHTTMHLLYARFFQKALYDLSLVPVSEPFQERYNRGLIMGPDGQKMSKRWGNVVNPDEMLEKYGADAVRMYLAFVGPYNEPGHYPWKLDGVEAMRRFLDRIYTLSAKTTATEVSIELQRAFATASAKIEGDAERFKFNTALSALMVLVKELETLENVPQDAWEEFLMLLAPFAPHLAEHLWGKLGKEGSVHQSSWPTADESLLVRDSVAVIVQVNGKRRGEVDLAPDASEAAANEAALALPTVVALLEGKPPSRVIYVPGRIINIVIG